VPDERAAADQRTAYSAIENEQARDARKIAEALFQPKPTTTIDDPAQPAAATHQEVARPPRILPVTEPRHDSITSPEQAFSPGTRKSNAEEIPPSEHSRIRTLAAYGMTLGEIAELYDAAEGEIAHIVKG
jgi:hypothetical protein